MIDWPHPHRCWKGHVKRLFFGISLFRDDFVQGVMEEGYPFSGFAVKGKGR
jgi:hypothetical protein